MQRNANTLWSRIAVSLGAALVTAGLMGAPALAEEQVERKVKIKVMAGGMTDAEAIDVSDLGVGETRWVTTASGGEVGITREESGYRISVDGEETFVASPHAGDGHGFMFRTATSGEAGEDGAQKVIVRHMAHAGEGGEQNMVFVTDSDQVIDLAGVSDTVFIAGLGDLDESRKQAIIDALRQAGVEKEIHFTPGDPHGFRFVSGEGADGGEDVNVNVQKIITGDGDKPAVVVIEKRVEKQDE